MIQIDEDEPFKLDLVELINSQCVDLTSEDISVPFHVEIIEWLKENAGERLEQIPFAEAEAGYLPDITNKWASHLTITRLIYWIQNKETRVEFAMRWL